MTLRLTFWWLCWRSRKITFTSLINRGEIIWYFLAKQVSRTVESRKTSTHLSVHKSLWCRINKRLKFIALPRSRSNTFTYFCVGQQQRTGGMWEIITTLFQAIKSLKVPVWNVNFAINYVRSQNRCRFRVDKKIVSERMLHSLGLAFFTHDTLAHVLTQWKLILSSLHPQQVNTGSIADNAGLKAGDAVVRLNQTDLYNLRHKDAQDAIVRAGPQFELVVQRLVDTALPLNQTLICCFPAAVQHGSLPSRQLLLQSPETILPSQRHRSLPTSNK